jgi:hypothetical protein
MNSVCRQNLVPFHYTVFNNKWKADLYTYLIAKTHTALILRCKHKTRHTNYCAIALPVQSQTLRLRKHRVSCEEHVNCNWNGHRIYNPTRWSIILYSITVTALHTVAFTHVVVVVVVVTGLFFLVLLLVHLLWSPPLRLQVSDCSTFLMCVMFQV